LYESEQAATVLKKQELQKKQKILDIVRQNFTALLNAPELSRSSPIIYGLFFYKY